MKIKEETNELWEQYLRLKKVEDRDELIVHYLFLVKYVVGRLGTAYPSHVKLDDLYSSGVTGLVRAVEKFDPAKNRKFESYAIMLIKGAIIDELRELDWIPRSVHQKANWINGAQEELHQKLGREPTDHELSHHMGLEEQELSEMIDRVRPAVLIPLNAEASSSEEDSTTMSEKIPDLKASTGLDVAKQKECARLVEKALSQLSEQEQKVLTLYYYEDLMLKEIGKILGVSESRISQIHTKALLKLRGRLGTLGHELVRD